MPKWVDSELALELEKIGELCNKWNLPGLHLDPDLYAVGEMTDNELVVFRCTLELLQLIIYPSLAVGKYRRLYFDLLENINLNLNRASEEEQKRGIYPAPKAVH
ncbi:hypothetical protein GEN90_24680 [Vibrio parahaemolyticus]|nr:hypothetical protein [Vibrio parahaemolyticus]